MKHSNGESAHRVSVDQGHDSCTPTGTSGQGVLGFRRALWGVASTTLWRLPLGSFTVLDEQSRALGTGVSGCDRCGSARCSPTDDYGHIGCDSNLGGHQVQSRQPVNARIVRLAVVERWPSRSSGPGEVVDRHESALAKNDLVIEEQQRDKAVRDKFLDASAWPTISFRSTQLVEKGANWSPNGHLGVRSRSSSRSKSPMGPASSSLARVALIVCTEGHGHERDGRPSSTSACESA